MTSYQPNRWLRGKIFQFRGDPARHLLLASIHDYCFEKITSGRCAGNILMQSGECKQMVKKLVLTVTFLAVGAVVWIGVQGGARQLEVTNAYVTGRVLQIAAPSDGVIDVVRVSRGDSVKRGDLLIALDSERDAISIQQRIQELRVALKGELISCL